MQRVLERISAWLTLEPVLGIMMIAAAFVLFVLKLKERKSEDDKFWQWARRILEAVGTALIFLILLWVFRGVLNANYATYNAGHGRVSEVNFNSVQTRWGGPLVQRDLTVSHFREQVVTEEVPREDPSLPPLYKRTRQKTEVPENSIVSSQIKARLVQNSRQLGSASYAGFETSFDIRYEIVNDSNYTTTAEFALPLSKNQPIFDKLIVLENGVSLSDKIQVSKSAIDWSREMAPGQKLSLELSYTTRGLDYFYYQIPSPREINNFTFQLSLDDLPPAEINYPNGCFPPTEPIKPINDGKGSLLEWRFNNAITTAGMGIALPKPEQPGVREAQVLAHSPYALMFLVITVCLTFLILGRKVNLLQVAILAGLYCLLYYVISSLSDLAFGFWGTLIPGALLTIGLIFLLFIREESKLIRALVLGVAGFFTLVSPLLTLIPDYQASIGGITVILIILYLFGIIFFTQIRKRKDKAAD